MKLIYSLLVGASLLGAETFTGVITDSMCGANHKSMNINPDEKCVKEWAKASSFHYVLMDGKNSYKLSDQKTPEQFAARKVRVTGKLFAKTGIIQVDKIEYSK